MNSLRYFILKCRPNVFKIIRRMNSISIPRNIGTSIFLSSTYVHEKVKKEESSSYFYSETTEFESLDVGEFQKLIKNACDLTEDRIKELIKVLKAGIQKSSEEYRKLTEEQIQIIKKGCCQDPLSPYWDKLVEKRVEAQNIKIEIEKFESLIGYVEKLTVNLHMCKTMLENKDSMISVIEKEIQDLKSIKEQQIKMNKKVEEELLKMKKSDILKAK